MRVFYNDSFSGHWPVGTCAIVVAAHNDDAAFKLQETLKEHGLAQLIDPSSMKEINIKTPGVIIVDDGNY